MSDSSFYKYHAFICDNQREEGHVRECCAAKGSAELMIYLKRKVKALKLNGKGKLRINKSGCLDRCELGPVMVIYPQETWYSPKSKADIDEILESHLIGGEPVERLKIARK